MQGQLLDRIIMVDLSDNLEPIKRDEVEEKQRNNYHTSK